MLETKTNPLSIKNLLKPGNEPRLKAPKLIKQANSALGREGGGGGPEGGSLNPKPETRETWHPELVPYLQRSKE